MNGLLADLAELEALKQGLAAAPAVCDVLVCPPASLIAPAAGTAQGGDDAARGRCGRPVLTVRVVGAAPLGDEIGIGDGGAQGEKGNGCPGSPKMRMSYGFHGL